MEKVLKVRVPKESVLKAWARMVSALMAGVGIAHVFFSFPLSLSPLSLSMESVPKVRVLKKSVLEAGLGWCRL
jgi:ABC-type molybdate transport system permease subunit